MSPTVLIFGGAIGLGALLLIIGLFYEWRHKRQTARPKAEVSRSRVYEVQMRDHRRSLVWTTVITIILVSVALLEWSSFQFHSEWSTASAQATRLQRGESYRRGDTDYYVDVWYRFTINETRYEGSGRLSYEQEGRRDEVYNSLNGGSTLRVWYHPLVPFISFAWKTGPVFSIAVLAIASLTGLGMISSGVALITTRLKGGPKQRPTA
jgi:hypothetical protein